MSDTINTDFKSPGPRTVSLSLREIIYDIQNKTYLTGKARADGANHRQVAQMQANDDDDNLSQILRSVHTAIGNLRQVLGDWLSGTSAMVTDNLPEDLEKDEVTLTLELPSNFNHTVLRSLVDSMHRYAVAYAVAEWFVITNREDAAQYTSIADASIALIRQAMSQRVRPARKTS